MIVKDVTCKNKINCNIFFNHVLQSTKIITTSKVDKTFSIKRKRENRNKEKERKRENRNREKERKRGKIEIVKRREKEKIEERREK